MFFRRRSLSWGERRQGLVFGAPWLLTGMALGRRGLEGERGFPAPRLLAQREKMKELNMVLSSV